MVYHLSDNFLLKWLEIPCLYNIKSDELYELDEESFKFLKACIKGMDYCEDEKFLQYCLNEGILSTTPRVNSHPLIQKSPIPSLRYLELQITNRCNLQCKHCYINEGNTSELSLSEILTVLREFEEIQGLRVMITGGEPLFYSRFNELNEHLPEFKIRKVLFSNGINLSSDILKKLNVEEIQISIDGLERSHDLIRGKGTFKKAMESLRLAKEHGFDVSVATVIHAENLHDLDELEKVFLDMAVKTWTVDIPCNEGRLRANREFLLSPERAGKYLRYGFGEDLHYTAKGFACGLHLMAITSDGGVAKCTFYNDKKVGHISEGLRTCWQRINPVRIEELKCDCEFTEICRGGCRFRAESLTGDPYGKDLYRCSFYLNNKNGDE